MSLLDKNFIDIRSALDNGEVTSVDLTKTAIERVNAGNKNLNAYISINEDKALVQAAEADKRLKQGERNPVLGIPVGVKDLILTKGIKTTAASKMLENFVAPYDATVSANLKKQGSPIIGKCNLDEYAMGSSNETSYFGPCKNPWDLERVPGGSSGGSAVSVAARMTPFSLGTDTGGSIRQPASLCGVTGIKPTYGRVSRYGVVAFASSLDQVGTFGIDALACAASLEAIAGFEVHDATSSESPVPEYYKQAVDYCEKNSIKGKKIGVPVQFSDHSGVQPDVSNCIEESLKKLQSMGAELVEVDLPHMKYSLPVYYIVCTSECSSNLARYDGIHYGHRTKNIEGATLDDIYSRSRAEGFGSEVQLRIMMGTYALSSGYYDAYYNKASQIRELIRRDYEQAFAKCDLIAGPTAPTTAFKLGEKTSNPMEMYLSDVYTMSTNLAGIPGLSFNVGYDKSGLPIGMQLMAPWWGESEILGAAASFQKQFPESVGIPDFCKKEEG